jgi:hypothetical protein
MGNKFRYTIAVDGAQAMITTEEEYAMIFIAGVLEKYWGEPRITIGITREQIKEYDTN